MECRDWQRMIQPFLDDSMNMDELGRFVKHIRTCTECYEELEVMFMFSSALQELESDYLSSYNFQELLKKKLIDAENNQERQRNFRNLCRMVYALMSIVVLIGMIMQVILWTSL